MREFGCEQLTSKLDDLIDQTLSDEEAEAVRAHLAGCTRCGAEVERARGLAAAVNTLPRSVEPEKDLWPGIASAIQERRVVRDAFDRPPWAHQRPWLRLAAAAAVLVAAVTIAYMAGLERGRPRIVSAPPFEEIYTQAAYGDLTDDLEDARDLLRASLEQRRPELSPETWAVVTDNLVVIDEAIVRIETAMEDHPDDGRLNRQLALAYRRQIDLLQRATLLPAEI